MKESPNDRQTKIFRKMSADKKIKMVDNFFKFARRLEQDKDPEVRIVLDD